MTAVFMFPGQTSHHPEMLDRLCADAPELAATARIASEVLGRDVLAPSRVSEYARNRDLQVSVFLANHLHLVRLGLHGIEADRSLGLSLGEYNHLVHSGALSFEDALTLVDARGAAYDEAPAGCMASVFPLPEDELAPLVAQGSAAGDVFIANYNSPNQHVIGGTRAGVDAVCELVERTTTAQARTIDDRRAMHTPLFASVAAAFRPHVLRAPFRPLARPYLPNVLGHPAVDTQLGLLTDLLASHVERPVRFRHSVDWLVANTPDPIFVEVGAGSVLFNLLQRRWHPFRKLKTEDKDGVVAIARLHEGLGKGAAS